MGQVLYRKYRSKSLEEIVGQEHVTRTLANALREGRIGHAYLLSGPRGVGKTSVARILAYAINDLPYIEDGPQHIDIIEIDAASNRGVDEIRDLRDKARIVPAAARYKVYIVDEVHMLTGVAVSALLKTLEEPPAHVVFILATTEAHKLPPTIISRTQHFIFRPVPSDKVVEHLSHIARLENIAVTPEALQLIAEHGQGSFRDSIGLLDQVGNLGDAGTPVDAEAVRQLLGIAPDAAIDELISAAASGGNPAAIMNLCDNLYSQGLRATALSAQLSGRLRRAYAAGQPPLPAARTLDLLKQLIEIPASRDPERWLEIVLLDAARASAAAAPTLPDASSVPTAPAKTHTPSATDDGAKTRRHKPAEAKVAAPAATKPVPQGASAAVSPAAGDPPPTAAMEAKAIDMAVWQQVLDALRKQHNTLYGVLRLADPVFTDGHIELRLKFAFHKKRLSEAKNRQIIAGFVKQLSGQTTIISCTLAAPADKGRAAAGAAIQPPAPLDTIHDIFGGGELLAP